MNRYAYPNLRQTLMVILFFFSSFALFFFLTGILPKIFGWQLTGAYTNFIFSVASPVCTIPLIIYVSKKSGIPVKWKVKLPSIRILFLLVLLSISVRIFILPLINPIEYFNNLIVGRYKLIDFVVPKFNFYTTVNFLVIFFIAPVFEEIFWRKQILSLLLKKYSPVISIVFSSMLFACAHGRINDIGALFFWGFLFSFVYYKINSLEFSIILHSFANGIGFFIKHEFINKTELPFFKYSLMIVVNVIIILLVVKYIVEKSSLKKDLVVNDKLS